LEVQNHDIKLILEVAQHLGEVSFERERKEGSLEYGIFGREWAKNF
jgi:hypothetical protein